MKHSGNMVAKTPDRPNWQEGGFALYVHWPFCLAKCPYCDFNSHVVQSIDQNRWAVAYVEAIAAWGRALPDRVLTSIYFGGGTPSLMPAETVEKVISAARAAWATSNDIEITLEANPTSVELERFRAFSDAGVNRISLGIQALDDQALRLLGRQHSVKDALMAWDVARSVFARASFDIIYSRQFQDLASWKSELRTALSLSPDHLSLYQLTIEDGTAFGDRYKIGRLPGLPDDDRGADMFHLTQDICDEAGLSAYEVSNHARSGQESRHNLVYWRYGDYVGVGPGAHGRIEIAGRRYATTTERSPAAWLEHQPGESNPLASAETVLPVDSAEEYLMMSLRLTEGADLARHALLGGRPIPATAIDSLCELGLLWSRDARIGATRAGRPLLNGLLRALL